ncbi:MAG: NUDIX hydrolase [Spirochaetes bacterium]|nr:NUDIX hydrolase [Spirochaetota bacterium]
MHRKKLLDLLERYRKKNPDESAVVDRFVSFISANPGCFKRSLQEGHITGSAWVVDKSGTRVLLTHHKRMDKWVQLGGHTDGHHDVLETALREAEEESGIDSLEPLSEEIFDIAVHTVPALGDEPEHFHYDVRFAVTVTDSEDYTVSDESHDLAWVEVDKLSEYTREESMLRMGRKWEKRAFSY